MSKIAYRGAITAPAAAFQVASGGTVSVIDYSASVAELAGEERGADLRSFLANEWTPYHVKGLDKLRARVLKRRPIPEDVQQTAAHHAPRLSALMMQTTNRMVRHQTAGALDTTKLVRLASPSSAAQFDRDAATAFRRRSTATAQRPLKIAIVADTNNTVRTDNPTYMPNLGKLAHILCEAAGGAGLQAACYMARGQFSASGGFANALREAGKAGPICVLSRVTDYGQRITPSVFHAITDAWGFVAPFLNCIPFGGGSHNGTGGIDYAREHDSATFVVAIGTFYDSAKADVHLSPRLSIDAMVAKVEEGLKAYVSAQRHAA